MSFFNLMTEHHQSRAANMAGSAADMGGDAASLGEFVLIRPAITATAYMLRGWRDDVTTIGANIIGTPKST